MDCGVEDKIWHCFQILVVWESIELHIGIQWTLIRSFSSWKGFNFGRVVERASSEIPPQPSQVSDFVTLSSSISRSWGKLGKRKIPLPARILPKFLSNEYKKVHIYQQFEKIQYSWKTWNVHLLNILPFSLPFIAKSIYSTDQNMHYPSSRHKNYNNSGTLPFCQFLRFSLQGWLCW